MARHFGGAGPISRTDRAKVLIFVLGVFAILAFAAVALLLFSSKESDAAVKTVVIEKEVEIKMADVLIPIRKVESGEPLEPAMFKRESRPAVSVSDKVVRDFEEIKGHYAKALIVPGQPLHQDYITDIRPTNILTANIPDGYRAVTIRVDQRSSVEGWARPGAAVDVVWASRIRGKPGVTVIVQNAKVLSAERQTAVDTADGAIVPSTVTLLVAAKDAAKIQLASTTGSLSLSLRGDNDIRTDGGAGSITIDDLIGGATGQPVEDERFDTIVIDGQKWHLKRGKLVPLAKVNR